MDLTNVHIEWKKLFHKQPRRRLPTRARPEGTVITCGKCKKPARVYHFAWSAIRCPNCHADGYKQDWRFDANNQSIDARSAPTYKIIGDRVIE